MRKKGKRKKETVYDTFAHGEGRKGEMALRNVSARRGLQGIEGGHFGGEKRG